jgi:hypothetical protein
MKYADDARIGDVLADLRKARGLPLHPALATRWSFKLGPFRPTLPNFPWRRQAIDRHDLHHALIGAPCTLQGECEVAAWEFAAGPYPDLRPQLFCLPLVALGFLRSPRRIWRAFEAGRRQRTLYDRPLDDSDRLGELRAYINDCGRRRHFARDACAFALLLAASSVLVLAPAAVAALMLI